LAVSDDHKSGVFYMAKKRKKQIGRKQKKQNLTGLDFQSLLDLRNQVDEALTGYRSTLERQLVALGSSVASLGGKVARGMRGSKLKGMKVAPKYRGSGGELWAGRGATPRWLVAAIKEGKKLEDFLIDKATPTKRQRVVSTIFRTFDQATASVCTTCG
jgi:DNA-binding protein H-NS